MKNITHLHNHLLYFTLHSRTVSFTTFVRNTLWRRPEFWDSYHLSFILIEGQFSLEFCEEARSGKVQNFGKVVMENTKILAQLSPVLYTHWWTVSFKILWRSTFWKSTKFWNCCLLILLRRNTRFLFRIVMKRRILEKRQI